jgi:hypothetical protein
MSTLHPALAQALIAERQRDLVGARPGRRTRLTRPSTTHPEPSVRHRPGLLARLVPLFGARVRTA